MRTRVDKATPERINLVLEAVESAVWTSPKISADNLTTEAVTSDTTLTITLRGGARYKLLLKKVE